MARGNEKSVYRQARTEKRTEYKVPSGNCSRSNNAWSSTMSRDDLRAGAMAMDCGVPA